MTDAANTSDAETKPPYILVVDDNEMNRDLLVRRLERQNMRTAMAKGGVEALDRIKVEEFDLVLLDINMPDLDGIYVLEEARKRFTMAELPIIMVSALDESDSIAEVINKGANDYITKPVNFNVAFARINTHLSLSQTLTKLQDSQERFSLAFRGANDGLWDWDLRSRQIHFSDRWKEMLGLADVSLNHDPENWFKLVHPDEIAGLKLALEEHLLGQSEALKYEYRALHADGNFRWLLTRGVASRGEDGQAVRISGSLTDITKTKAYDPITAIPNKVLFMDRLEWLMDRDQDQGQDQFAVLLVKIDRLKKLRQSLGPVVGETILIETAKRLMNALGKDGAQTAPQKTSSITISRHDDADFAILLEGCSDETSAPKVGELIQKAISDPLIIDDDEITLSCSIGTITVSSPIDEFTTPIDIVSHAAAALDRAQSKGMGHFELFDSEMQGRTRKLLKMEHDLRRAIAANELELHFQPIVEVADGSISGCEALCRWSHPDHGNVSPEIFIPLAEKCGLIDAIGEWVLIEACNQHRKWVEEDGLPDIDMSVNLSVLQMQHDGIEYEILDILKSTHMDPKHLKLEITESIFMEDMDRINSVLSNLNDQGISIAIDDFGTGFSSLSYLNRLPITHLKIDRSFISEVSNDVAAQAIVQSTLLMAQSMGIAVVAEGIEELDQVALLQLLKAEYGQGFYYSKPLEASAFAALLSAQQKEKAS